MAAIIKPTEALKLINNGEAILIDVRENDEFSAEHIALATSMPLSGFAEKIKSLKLPENKKIIFQCKAGKRGGQACEISSQYFNAENILNLEGGIDAWKANGLEVISASKTIPLMRQVQIAAGSLILTFSILGFLINQAFFYGTAFIGIGLTFAGISGWCGMAMLLKKMPWNN